MARVSKVVSKDQASTDNRSSDYAKQRYWCGCYKIASTDIACTQDICFAKQQPTDHLRDTMTVASQDTHATRSLSCKMPPGAPSYIYTCRLPSRIHVDIFCRCDAPRRVTVLCVCILVGLIDLVRVYVAPNVDHSAGADRPDPALITIVVPRS